jgi:hypothetical protein
LRRPLGRILPAALVLLALLASLAHAADPVQRVEVRLTVEGGDPHPLIVQRLVETVGTAAERLLVGRDSELVGRQEAALAGVLREVVDRVVRGYRVTSLSFQPAATTIVQVAVQARPPVLGEVPVTVTLQGVHPDAQPLVRGVLEPALPELSRLSARLPTDALEWAGPIIERRVTEVVEATLVGFTATGRVEITPTPRIMAVVTARDSRTVRDLGIRFRSSSIPYVLLSPHIPQVTSMAELLRGLPVTFATAQRERLQALIGERLAAYQPVKDYSVVARPVLQVAEVTYVTVLADSTLYRGRLDARLNFGTAAPVPDVRGQLGRAFGSLEPFVEFRLIPSNLAVRTLAGLRFDLGESTTLGFRMRLDGEETEGFVLQRLSPDLQLKGAYFLRADTIEITFAYRFTDFLSWEAVVTSRGLLYVSIVSNL